MILGSYFMGLLADVNGRKVVLATTLILDGLCDFAFSFANNVYLYIFGRFLNGILYDSFSTSFFLIFRLNW